MSLMWYVYSNDAVSGPFSTENIEHGLTQNKWSLESLIWWKGQREWVSVDSWRSDLKNIVLGFRKNIHTTAWYVEHLGTQKGPMYSGDLQSFIQSNGIVGTCRVWTEGMDRWMNVYEITELVQFFGITRRKHPRAPIKTNLLIESNLSKDQNLVVHAGSISAGGLGVRGLNDVKKGDTVCITLQSNLLTDKVQSDAKVVYTSESGFTGLQFTSLKPESATAITNYVNLFQT
jgi:hypothetical protein